MTVGGVPSHFNAPWHYASSNGALRAAGLDVVWKDFQGGTSAMTQALGRGALDEDEEHLEHLVGEARADLDV